MKIEDYWEDKTIYHVELLVCLQNTERVICKTVTMPAELEDEVVIQHLKTKFNAVQKVLRIEELEYCLNLIM